MSDIVAAIDALIDQQLATGPQDDYNADRYDKCWHCGRNWHGLPITERIADMYAISTYDETYNAANDTSRTLCRGSDFIGPMPEEKRYETEAWRLGIRRTAPWVVSRSYGDQQVYWTVTVDEIRRGNLISVAMPNGQIFTDTYRGFGISASEMPLMLHTQPTTEEGDA